MALSVVQRKTAVDTSGTVGTVSAAFTSNITSGNTIVVAASMSDSTAVLFNKEFQPPTDTLGNKYYLVSNSGFDSTLGVGLEIWAAYNSSAGANTVSMTNNGNDSQISAYELAGVPYFGFDQSSGKVHTSNATFTTNNITTSIANEIIIAAFASGLSAWVAGVNYSNIQNQAGGSIELGTEERTVSATGTYNATATHTANTGMAAIASFADTVATSAVARITKLGSTYNTTSGTHTVTATPAVNDLIVIVRAATGSTASTAPTDNNSSGTYSLAVSVLRNTSADILEIWVRNALIASASSTVFTEAPGTTTGGGLEVFKVTGMSKTGATAIKQTTSQANQAANATPAPTFGSAPLTTNPIFSAAANGTALSGSGQMVGPVGHVNAPLVNYSTPTSTLLVTYAEGGVTTTAQTYTAQSASVWGSVAVELDASASGTVNNKSLTGTLSFTGTFSKLPGKALTATLSFSGSLAKRLARALTATLSFTGAFSKRLNRALSGAVSFVGSLAKSHIYNKALTAVLSFTGSLVSGKAALRSLTATLSFSGSVTKQTNKPLTAVLSFTGSFSKAFSKVFTSTLSFTGSFANNLIQVFLKFITMFFKQPEPIDLQLTIPKPIAISLMVPAPVSLHLTQPNSLSIAVKVPSSIQSGVSIKSPISINLAVPDPISISVKAS